MRETGSELVYVFRTQRVAFLLVPQSNQVGRFAEFASRVETKWGGLLDTRRYLAKNGILTTGSLPTVMV